MVDSELERLIETLSDGQRGAIRVVRLMLDCFNSADGTGLFAGVDRYSVLAGRLEICAVQARSLVSFWALVLRRMQWPVPPKRTDAEVLAVLSSGDAASVLRSMATETSSIVTLSRMLHDEGKRARRETPDLNYSDNILTEASDG